MTVHLKTVFFLVVIHVFGASAYAQDEVATQPYILNVVVDGGWDTTMVFENKVGSASIAQEEGATYRESASGMSHVAHPDRPAVDAFFDTYGGSCAIVNGLSSGSLEDRQSYLRSFASIPAESAGFYDWATWYALNTGPNNTFPMLVVDTPQISEYCVRNCRYLDSSRLDSYTSAIPDATEFPTALRDMILSHLAQKYAEKSVAISPGGIDFLKMYSLANQFQTDHSYRTTLTNIIDELNLDPAESLFLRSGKVIMEFFRDGHTRSATIRFGAAREWDTQVNHFSQASALYQSLFTELNALLEYASTSGLLPNMLITVTSNLGRAPNLNEQAGKDRWQFTSAMLCGNGVKGATIVGLTDDYLRGVPLNPLFGTADGTNDVTIEFKNVIAALFLKYGLPYDTYVLQTPLSPIIGP